MGVRILRPVGLNLTCVQVYKPVQDYKYIAIKGSVYILNIVVLDIGDIKLNSTICSSIKFFCTVINS